MPGDRIEWVKGRRRLREAKVRRARATEREREKDPDFGTDFSLKRRRRREQRRHTMLTRRRRLANMGRNAAAAGVCLFRRVWSPADS